MISGAMQYKKKVQPVMGKQIAYIEEGEGEPAPMVALVESYGAVDGRQLNTQTVY